MAKNIVLCLDGTGAQVQAKGNTNVLILFGMLDLSDPDRQVEFYDPGVGTFGAPGAWSPLSKRLTKLAGLAFGYGIKTNLAEAYTYLIDHYRPGDRVYIFGYSRGAFTARGLAGLTHRAGLMRPGAQNLVSYLVRAYTKGNNWSDDDWEKVDLFAERFSHEIDGSRSMPIHFLGMWDSVKALGYFRFDPKWPYTRQLPNARTIRHAVSIDERRRPYREYLVTAKDPAVLTETWFAGVHSDVGGGFVSKTKLSDVTLKWMTDGALDQGLLLRPGAYQESCSVSAAHATADLHKVGRIWALLTYRNRPIAPPNARVHQTVSDRIKAKPPYQIDADPNQVQWDDPHWILPHPDAPTI
jgi:uncharacterized protein (DUF2235 family)